MYLIRLVNSPNNKDTTHISRQLQWNSWDVIIKYWQSSLQECVSGLCSCPLNKWEVQIENPHCDQIVETKPFPQENLCLKRGLRIVFLWDILKSVVKKETQTNKMEKQDADVKKRQSKRS